MSLQSDYERRAERHFKNHKIIRNYWKFAQRRHRAKVKGCIV
jgi:hypothetical protein